MTEQDERWLRFAEEVSGWLGRGLQRFGEIAKLAEETLPAGDPVAAATKSIYEEWRANAPRTRRELLKPIRPEGSERAEGSL